jgi:hypothetical protein
MSRCYTAAVQPFPSLPEGSWEQSAATDSPHTIIETASIPLSQLKGSVQVQVTGVLCAARHQRDARITRLDVRVAVTPCPGTHTWPE